MVTKDEISAGGIVFKKKNDQTYWLIVQHSQHKGWVFPKGLVGDKEDESMEEAALRETKEEGGVKTRVVAKLEKPVGYSYRFKGTLIRKTVHYYLMEHLSGNPKDHDWEVSEAKFFPTDKVKKVLTYDSDRQAFAQALKLFSKLSK